MTHSAVEFHSSLQRGSSVDRAEVVQSWKHRAVGVGRYETVST